MCVLVSEQSNLVLCPCAVGGGESLVIRRWWSDDTSAPLITRTSCRDLLNLRLMHMWSIWFSVTWFGDIHVALWMRLCGKMLPPVTSYRLVGLVVRRPPRERKVPGSNPASAGIFSGPSHTSDLNIGTPVATLSGAWRYRVSTGTGRPGVSIL